MILKGMISITLSENWSEKHLPVGVFPYDLSLNINFIAPKFEQLKEVIGNHLDILTIQETKIDDSFQDDLK